MERLRKGVRSLERLSTSTVFVVSFCCLLTNVVRFNYWRLLLSIFFLLLLFIIGFLKGFAFWFGFTRTLYLIRRFLPFLRTAILYLYICILFVIVILFALFYCDYYRCWGFTNILAKLQCSVFSVLRTFFVLIRIELLVYLWFSFLFHVS